MVWGAIALLSKGTDLGVCSQIGIGGSSKAARRAATNLVQVGKDIAPVVPLTCGWNHSLADPARKEAAYAILELSALAPVYRSGSELNITLSCMMHDLYSDRVPSNSLGGVTGILTTLVLAKVFLRLSRFNYERIEVLQYSLGRWSTGSDNNKRTTVTLTVTILILIIYSGK